MTNKHHIQYRINSYKYVNKQHAPKFYETKLACDRKVRQLRDHGFHGTQAMTWFDDEGQIHEEIIRKF